MRLRCISPYRNEPRSLAYQVGAIIDDPVLVAYLMKDAPGCFVEHTEVKAAKVVEDKAIKTSPANKGIL